ncbi:MAG: alpha/beta fold hydrolase [Candidatus Obscuribacterales bacterium]|nr:alpha/beta fold hydrolase [Candidatus Obscuribacterales bacterium]
MTIVPGFLPRKLAGFEQSGQKELIPINSETSLLAYLHWQEGVKSPLAIILHGLEGSSQSSHVLGIGSKLYASGFNVLRLNMRNCGGSAAYSKTLYNAGMWEDARDVMSFFHHSKGVDEFILVGYSLGGNLLLNTASNHEGLNYEIKAACAVSPSIDLANSVAELEKPQNQIYQNWFLRTMKARILAKAKQYPETYDARKLKQIKSVRDFDEIYTAPHGGYGTADRYYHEASSILQIRQIKCPTLILAAEDDPLVPIDSFHRIDAQQSNIEILITKAGGHGGFYQNSPEDDGIFDQFWAENRVVEFIKEVSSIRS